MDKIIKDLIINELSRFCDDFRFIQSYLNNTRAASNPEIRPVINAAQKKFDEGLEILANTLLKIK